MKKNLFRTLTCVGIIASMFFAIGASAATLENPTSSAGSPWGPSLKQYSDRNTAYVTNWDSTLHTVKAARRGDGDGDCIRLQRTSKDGDNWVKVSNPSGTLLTAGTEYNISVDYLPGPFGYNWGSFGMQVYVGGKYLNFSGVKTPVTTTDTWETFSQDFTATGTNVPQIKLLSKSSDIYLDNLVIKEKSTGNIVFYNNFDMLKIDYHNNWGYMPSPEIYAETNAVPFYGIPGNDSIGVIKRDGGYAAYIRNAKSYDVSWRFSDMEAKVRALPDGQYKVKYDYVYCDTSLNNQNYLADRMSWSESVSAATYSWATFETTFTKSSSTQCGFKIKPGCRMCVDNLTVEDLDGNLIAIEDFDTVPLWGGTNQFVVEPTVLTQEGEFMNVSAKVTNSCADTKKLVLITAIYSGVQLESVDSTKADIVGDPRGINHTTTISSRQNVSGLQGKTFKVFLWDGSDFITPLSDSATKTIN